MSKIGVDKMDSKILLGKILQRLSDVKVAKVDGYSSFGYIKETENAVFVTRETGEDTRIPFEKILKGIETYKLTPSFYQQGPSVVRDFGIPHVTSPVWALLHLLKEYDYE